MCCVYKYLCVDMRVHTLIYLEQVREPPSVYSVELYVILHWNRAWKNLGKSVITDNIHDRRPCKIWRIQQYFGHFQAIMFDIEWLLLFWIGCFTKWFQCRRVNDDSFAYSTKLSRRLDSLKGNNFVKCHRKGQLN